MKNRIIGSVVQKARNYRVNRKYKDRLFRLVFQDKEDTIRNHVYARIKYLYAKDKRVSALFENNDICDSTKKSRKQIISELDCLVGAMYGLSTEQIKEIASTFDKYYTKKEVEQWF